MKAAEGVKAIVSKPWRNSATLILATKTKSGFPSFLMMERSKGSSFMPGGLCFPGGTVSKADSNPEWINYIKKSSGVDVLKFNFFAQNANVPSIYENDVENGNNAIPKQISLRITAIREMFEECGILLCSSQKTKDSPNKYFEAMKKITDQDGIEKWQEKIRKDPNEFLNLCDNFSIFPDLPQLFDWSNWLTPNVYKQSHRFDTIFYSAIVEEPYPIKADEREVAKAFWKSANEYSISHSNKTLLLLPPQYYEINRLENVTTQRFQELLQIRRELGIERWLPFICEATNGPLFLMPGDSLYPEDLDKTLHSQERYKFDLSIEELRAKSKILHRRESLDGTFDFVNVLSTIPQRFGHVYE